MGKQFNQHSGLTPEERFWDKVNKTDTCWLWTANTSHGYGLFMVEGKRVRTHVYSFIIANGGYEKGLVVCHSCDTPTCVNPAHLSIGTQADNLRDMYQKGRGARQQLTHCKHGHELTEDNIHRSPSKPNTRQCKQCRRTRTLTYRGGYAPQKTHCSNGHEYTTENTGIKNGHRCCLICQRASFKKYREKLKVQS